ncbi:carboxypeptidase-like regulatory domain-containing protein [Muricauda sp. CAU 1633]|uniref:carboxypeptidase-like regulatory domain-containing protein n=1 Tax=Allomuricauda sp. CAU 1633 TaxID=2816036 RepID=UPI001A8D699F|nr:carboxypeptidase-like regulatory domain-containing protein [Muricauda sp. CAU 1633]MBO0321858.1 carboxypeptidase-like regulatory domain-containing protein [Muricauda sp. CAU 1633]
MRIVIFMLVLFSFPCLGMGQNVVSGKIIDELGLPIYFASVEINDTNEATYTDFDGNFSIESDKDFHWKLNISSKGYKTESYFVLSGGSAGEIVLQYDEELRKLLEGQ